MKKTSLTIEINEATKDSVKRKQKKKKLQSKPLKSKRKEFNINSKISKLENRKKKKQMHHIRKAKQDITTDRKEIKTS